VPESCFAAEPKRHPIEEEEKKILRFNKWLRALAFVPVDWWGRGQQKSAADIHPANTPDALPEHSSRICGDGDSKTFAPGIKKRRSEDLRRWGEDETA